jgi:hypothetical protein
MYQNVPFKPLTFSRMFYQHRKRWHYVLGAANELQGPSVHPFVYFLLTWHWTIQKEYVLWRLVYYHEVWDKKYVSCSAFKIFKWFKFWFTSWSKLEGSMGQCELVVLNGPNHWPSLGAYRERDDTEWLNDSNRIKDVDLSALYALWTVYGLYGVTGRKTKVSVLCIACRRYEQIQLPYAVHVQPGDMSIMCMCCMCMIVYALCDCTILHQQNKLSTRTSPGNPTALRASWELAPPSAYLANSYHMLRWIAEPRFPRQNVQPDFDHQNLKGVLLGIDRNWQVYCGFCLWNQLDFLIIPAAWHGP